MKLNFIEAPRPSSVSMDQWQDWTWQLRNSLKNLKDFNPKQFQSILLDNELMTQTLYEEIKKQNEILKLILRRASMAAGFSRQTAPEKSIEHDIVKQVNQEVAEIKI